MIKPRAGVFESISVFKTWEGYAAGDIRLDHSENPYGFRYNRYPDPGGLEINLAYRDFLYQEYPGLKLETQNLLFTRGAADALDLILRTYVGEGDRVCLTNPTFFMLNHWCKVYGIATDLVALAEAGSSIDVEQVLASDAKVCFLVNPGNPIPSNLRKDQILAIANNFKGLLVIDEAYVEFCKDQSFILELQQYPNLILVRSLSKAWGCAGLRAGFIIAAPEVVRNLKVVQAPFMCDVPTSAAITSTLACYADFDSWRSRLVEARSEFEVFLHELAHVDFIPSKTNFFLFSTQDSMSIYSDLYARGIKTRLHEEVAGLGPRAFIRMSIGTSEQMQAVRECVYELCC